MVNAPYLLVNTWDVQQQQLAIDPCRKSIRQKIAQWPKPRSTGALRASTPRSCSNPITPDLYPPTPSTLEPNVPGRSHRKERLNQRNRGGSLHQRLLLPDQLTQLSLLRVPAWLGPLLANPRPPRLVQIPRKRVLNINLQGGQVKATRSSEPHPPKPQSLPSI